MITQPIVVCGLPRSGTTLLLELLNSDPGIAIYDEFGDESILKLRDLVAAYRNILQNPLETWRNVTAAEFEIRIAQLAHSAFRVLSRRRHLRRPRAERYGFKLPLAENRILELDEIFGSAAPFYVYCLGEPAGVFESWASMPWGSDILPVDYFLSVLRSSLDSILRLRNRCPNRVHIVPTSAIACDVTLRQKVVRTLFDALDLTICREVADFTSLWPKVNTRDHAYRYYGELRNIDELAMTRSIAEVVERISQDVQLSANLARANDLATHF